MCLDQPAPCSALCYIYGHLTAAILMNSKAELHGYSIRANSGELQFAGPGLHYNAMRVQSV